MTSKQDVEETRQTVHPQQGHDAGKLIDTDLVEQKSNDLSRVQDREDEYSEWRGFSEAEYNDSEHPSQPGTPSGNDDNRSSPENLGPDHHLSIVNKFIPKMARQKRNVQTHDGTFRQVIYVEDSDEAEATRNSLMKVLDRDILKLIETGELSLDTLKKLEHTKPLSKDRPGIYIHVIYIPNKPNNLDITRQDGIYIGSALRLFSRIKRHKTERKDLLKPRKNKNDDRTRKMQNPQKDHLLPSTILA